MTRSDFSASNVYRRVLCPGSRAMEAGLPDVRTEDSNEGTLLHRLAADPSLSRADLDPEQVAALETNEAMQQEFIAFVKRENGLADDFQTHVEQEWWYHREKKPLFAMHPDKVLVWPTVAIVFDSKFGRESVPTPNVNWQLKTYVCGAAEQFPAYLIYGAITQPRLSRKVQSTVYGRTEIATARAEIDKAWDDSYQGVASLGGCLVGCRYCGGFTLGVCQQARMMALSPSPLNDLATSPETELANMAPASRARLFEAFALCRKLDKTFTDAAKKLVAKDAEFIPGWKLVPGGERETVTDTGMLFARLSKLGVTPNEFIDICTTPKKNLSGLVRAKTQLKGKELTKQMETLLAGVVDCTPIAPSLERV